MTRNRAKTILTVMTAVALLAWFWSRGERFIAANGPTFDEGVHLTAGFAYWTTGDFRMNAEDPPLLKLLWALPAFLGKAPALPTDVADGSDNHWRLADRWLYGQGGSPRSLIASARRINLAIGSALVVLVGWWAFRLGNSRLAAVATMGFACSDPTLLALSCILSTDVGLAFFGLLTCCLMWEYAAAPSRTILAALGVSSGLMLASKFSALGLVVGLGAAGLVYRVRGGVLTLPGKQTERGLRPTLELAFRLAAIAIATVAVTYAVIHFDQWGKGLKFQLTRGAHGDGVMYLNGELSRRGWYYYFVEAVALKLPLGLLIAASLGVAVSIRKSKNSKRNVWLIVPPVVFFALASYARIDMGIRVVSAGLAVPVPARGRTGEHDDFNVDVSHGATCSTCGLFGLVHLLGGADKSARACISQRVGANRLAGNAASGGLECGLGTGLARAQGVDG